MRALINTLTAAGYAAGMMFTGAIVAFAFLA